MAERLKVVDDGSIRLRDEHDFGKPVKACMTCFSRVGSYHSDDCRHQLKVEWDEWAPLVDLRGISREPERCLTAVHLLVTPEYRHPWIFAGQASFDRVSERYDTQLLRVYLGHGATDFEHDSAYALQLPLYGPFFKRVDYHRTVLRAFIPPDLPLCDFNVPEPGYDPFQLDGTHDCKECQNPHPVVPQGSYVPKGTEDRLSKVRGLRVELSFGPARKR